MEVLVLNPDLQGTLLIDTFSSLIWTDRFFECGDFEIETPATLENSKWAVDFMKDDHYLWCKDSEHLMVIESVNIRSDVEDGARLLVTGRSLESILDRRIVWTNTKLSGSFQNGIKRLLDENAIAPSDVKRKIPRLIFKASTDPKIVTLTIETQFARGDNLYDSIVALCRTNNVGFIMRLTENDQFEFSLYYGLDRSYEQEENPYVIFSNEFDNIISTDYTQSKKTFKNCTLVVGEEVEVEEEGSHTIRTQHTVEVGDYSGMERRETFTDASSISQTVDETKMPLEQYKAQLKEKGEETLSETKITEAFDGEMDVYGNFRFGSDFFMGDIVQVRNEYGIERRSRVTELILTQDSSGFTSYPTFSNME